MGIEVHLGVGKYSGQLLTLSEAQRRVRSWAKYFAW